MFTYIEKAYWKIYEWFNLSLGTLNGVYITPFTIFSFIFLICLALWLSRWVLHTMNRWGETRNLSQRFMIYRLARLAYYCVLILGIFIAISMIGIDFSHLVLIASALGIGLGIGLQSIFNHFVSGVILLFEDQLRLGDVIELEGGVRGEIQAINFRSVTLKTREGLSIIVPNASLINSRVAILPK